MRLRRKGRNVRAVMAGLLGGLLLAGIATAGDFEGIIVLSETSEGTTVQRRWFLKGDRLRFEETGPDAENNAMIFDAKKKVMYSLLHDERMYLEISTAESSKGAPEAIDDIVVMKTGASDKAAGYTCEIYRTNDKSDGSTGEVCMARGISNAALSGMMSAQAGGASLLPVWMQEMFKDGGFPIKGVDRNGQGKEEARWEAVTIEKKHLEDKLFVPPAGYHKQDMTVITPESASDPKPGPSMRGR